MIHRSSLRSAILALLLIAFALTLAGCSATPPVSDATAPSSAAPPATVGPPTIKVVTPAAASTVAGTELLVRIETTGLRFTNPSNTLVAGEGHVHFTLDDRPFEMSVEPEYVFTGLAPGPHVLRAELVQNDTEPFAPAVAETVEFTVE